SVLICLNHDFPKLAANLNIREHLLVSGVHVVYVVGCVLKITNDLTCFRADGEHTVREQAIQTFARSGIVWLRVPCSPINEIELRIVRAGPPCRSPALSPGVAVLWPCLRTRLARSGNCVSAPEFLSCVRIPTIEEAARRGLSTGDTRNQDAIGNDWRACGVVALAKVGEFLVPKLFAGFHIECEHMVVNRYAKDFAVINGRSTSVESCTLDPGFELHGGTPDLSAGFHIDGKGPLSVDHIHDAVIDRRRCKFTLVIHEARAPDGHKALDVGFIDYLERTVTLSVVAHALSRDVLCILTVVDQVACRLCPCRRGVETQ